MSFNLVNKNTISPSIKTPLGDKLIHNFRDDGKVLLKAVGSNTGINILVSVSILCLVVIIYLYIDLYYNCGYSIQFIKEKLKNFINYFTSIFDSSEEKDIDINNSINNNLKLSSSVETHLKNGDNLEININNSIENDINLDFNNIEDEDVENCNEPEVYNIDSNIYTYDDACLVCEALGGKLATYDQVLKAYNKGAHWCNYGWSANQMALFPIQKDKWEKMQECEETKDVCGKPGINGGYFKNKNLKFGVNCYGIKPKPDPKRIVYKEDQQKLIINKYKDQMKKGNIIIRPFNNNNWSKYSFKKSTYIIDNESRNPEIVYENVDDSAKDPYSYTN